MRTRSHPPARPARGFSRHAPFLIILGLIITTSVVSLIARGQTAPPATAPAPIVLQPADVDRLLYVRADRRITELVPEDTTFAPVNKDVLGATIVRPPAPPASQPSVGVWVVKPPATPATVPAPPVPAPPGVVVPSGSTGAQITAALKSAGPGGIVLLERGGTYAGQVDIVELRNVTLAAWGDASKPAPVILGETDKSCIFAWASDGVNVTGLKLQGTGQSDKLGAGMDLLGIRDWVVQDVEMTLGRYGATVQAARDRRSDGVTFERCNIHHNSPVLPTSRGSGIFAQQTDNLKINRCRVQFNGWSPTNPGNSEDHGLYLAGNCGPGFKVTNNLITDNSSHGAQVRAGGDVQFNRFERNPIHLSWALVNGAGPVHIGGCSGIVSDNYFEETRDAAGSPRGWGVELGNNTLDGQFVRNELYRVSPIVPAQGAIVAAIKVDVGRLDDGVKKGTVRNPDFGKEIGVRSLIIMDNAVTWPSTKNAKTKKADGPVWVHPDLVKAQQLRDSRTRIIIQTAFPPAVKKAA